MLLSLLTGCNVNNAQNSQSDFTVVKDSLPTRRALRRSLFEKREILIAYATKDVAIKKKYEALLKDYPSNNRSGRRNITIKFKDASNLTKDDIKNNILLLVGTPEANPFIKNLTKDIPVSFTDNGIIFNKKRYNAQEEIISLLSFPNPKNYNLPFGFISGNDDQEVYDFFETKSRNSRFGFFYRRNMDYEIHRAKSRILMGNFDKNWKLDKTAYFDFSSANDTVYQSEHYKFVTHQKAMPEAKISDLASKIESTTDQLLDFVNYDDKLPKITYHIYNTAEDKGLMVNNTRQAHYDTDDHSVHTIINEKYKDNFIKKENNLLLFHALGTPRALALERGLAVYFTDQWQREGYQYWTARMFESENALTLKELFDNELIEKESPLLVECMSASMVAFLIEKWGKKSFLEKYGKWMPGETELKKMEKEWQAYLKRVSVGFKKKKRTRSKLAYLKGFNFAHEGYSIYNGYLSKKATEAIKKQKDLGSNSLAIVPYSYIQSGAAPTYLSIGNRAGSENDEGVVHSAYEAKRMGMTAMLKPQVFFGNSWPGEMEYKTEAEWDAFFDYYYRWIRHYAFLAEIHEIDILCVGVEFSIATLTHEDSWRKMFKKLKGFYQGKLTYAANWGEEFEKLSFWNELDFIGLNSYYPLSKNQTATDEELEANFDKVKNKIATVYEKFKKPVVFTEIGFRSIDAPWITPYADGDNSFNEDHQNRCYEVIFNGIKDAEWCKGILWWKFPSYLEYRGRENNAFTPNNKKAEATVKKWFSK